MHHNYSITTGKCSSNESSDIAVIKLYGESYSDFWAPLFYRNTFDTFWRVYDYCNWDLNET